MVFIHLSADVGKLHPGVATGNLPLYHLTISGYDLSNLFKISMVVKFYRDFRHV